MGYDLDKLYEGPRSERRAKRKRINFILNVLIGVVIVLIVFIGGKLIFGDKTDNNSATTEENQPQNENEATTPPESEEQDPQEEEDKPASTVPENEKERNQENEVDEEEVDQQPAPEPESTDDAEISEGDPESNIAKTIVNPAWQPIGTVQEEPHLMNYEAGSIDRAEMETAVSYATALDKSDIVVWWLGRNGENSVSATISSKSNKQVYRVYLEWVAAEGWKPVRVEELKENDSPTYKKNDNEDQDNENNE